MEIHGWEFSDVLFLLLFSFLSLKAHLQHLTTSVWLAGTVSATRKIVPYEAIPGTVALKGHFKSPGQFLDSYFNHFIGRKGKLICITGNY